MAATPSLRLAPAQYDPAAENLFRRELENILVIALSIANQVASGTATPMSHTLKRNQYLPSIGLHSHG
jgi:hypothetical protein